MSVAGESEATYGFDASKYCCVTLQESALGQTKHNEWVKLEKYQVPPTRNVKFENFLNLAFKSQMPASEVQN